MGRVDKEKGMKALLEGSREVVYFLRTEFSNLVAKL